MGDNIQANLRAGFLLFLSILVILATVISGLVGHLFYWLIFEVFTADKNKNNRKLTRPKDLKDDERYALIIGSGFSGLGMAVKLNQLGMDDYVIIERHGQLGGTWYANKYPGCACDVPSNLYSFSFEPNPNWSYFFSRQPEIGQYLEKCADKYDIRRHVKFNTTVTELRWLDDRQVWQVTTQSNGEEKQIFARYLMAGYGPLSNASYPTEIPGLDKFEGEMCHTAEWNTKLEFANKRVAVIGTGASAIQTVPEVHKSGVTKLYVFQRTPPWVIPRADRVVTDFEKKLFKKFPMAQKFVRAIIYWIREATALAFAYRLPIRHAYQGIANFNLTKQVKDENLRKKLTPTWDLGCKRVLVTNDWYSTIQKPNVEVVTNRIKEIRANSIVTYDGDEYPVDIIIWSTGFQIQTFSLPVYGTNGTVLSEQWQETMQAYRGVTVPNFPNFFILLGPNSGLGHNSIVLMIEAQVDYISEALLYAQEYNVRSLDVKQNVHDEFNKRLQLKLKNTVWQKGGCHSWYQDAKGNNTTIWPHFTWVYILYMKNFDAQSYVYH